MQRVSLSKQDMELAWGKGKSRDILGWPPGEPAFGKSFGHKPEPVAVKYKDFKGVSCPICKDEDNATEWIFIKGLPTKGGQPVNSPSEIRWLYGQTQPVMGGNLQHALST